MNSNPLIDRLNLLLEWEYTALECYRMHAEAIPEPEIAAGVRAIIPAEHAHAVNLTTRIDELGGDPVRRGGPASVRGREWAEISRDRGTLAMLRLELQQEQQAVKDYAVSVADILEDIATVEVLEEILYDEMRHAKWLKQKIMELEGKAWG